MAIEDIESTFMASPVAKTNWASHVIMLNSSLPLGLCYWYMKQSVEMGWSSNVLKIQIDSDLYSRQISNNKVNNFTATLPAQQNFYINVVDDKLRGENDNKTIGLLLCKGKDEVVAQYALTGYDQPIGISDYQLSKAIPENLKSALPSIEEVEEELASFLDKDKNP